MPTTVGRRVIHEVHRRFNKYQTVLLFNKLHPFSSYRCRKSAASREPWPQKNPPCSHPVSVVKTCLAPSITRSGFVVESDLKHLMEFICESDSPIKMDLFDIPHVANSEKTPSSSFFFFLNKVHKMERASGRGVDGLWVGGFHPKREGNSEKSRIREGPCCGDARCCGTLHRAGGAARSRHTTKFVVRLRDKCVFLVASKLLPIAHGGGSGGGGCKHQFPQTPPPKKNKQSTFIPNPALQNLPRPARGLHQETEPSRLEAPLDRSVFNRIDRSPTPRPPPTQVEPLRRGSRRAAVARSPGLGPVVPRSSGAPQRREAATAGGAPRPRGLRRHRPAPTIGTFFDAELQSEQNYETTSVRG